MQKGELYILTKADGKIYKLVSVKLNWQQAIKYFCYDFLKALFQSFCVFVIQNIFVSEAAMLSIQTFLQNLLKLYSGANPPICCQWYQTSFLDNGKFCFRIFFICQHPGIMK